MNRLTVREFIDLLEEDIENGVINKDDYVCTNFNGNLGYITDWESKLVSQYNNPSEKVKRLILETTYGI